MPPSNESLDTSGGSVLLNFIVRLCLNEFAPPHRKKEQSIVSLTECIPFEWYFVVTCPDCQPAKLSFLIHLTASVIRKVFTN